MDMMIVAEVCSLLRRLVGFVCFIYSPDAVQAMEEVCHLTLVIFFVVLFLLVANTQLTPFRLWRRYVLFFVTNFFVSIVFICNCFVFTHWMP